MLTLTFMLKLSVTDNLAMLFSMHGRLNSNPCRAPSARRLTLHGASGTSGVLFAPGVLGANYRTVCMPMVGPSSRDSPCQCNDRLRCMPSASSQVCLRCRRSVTIESAEIGHKISKMVSTPTRHAHAAACPAVHALEHIWQPASD